MFPESAEIHLWRHSHHTLSYRVFTRLLQDADCCCRQLSLLLLSASRTPVSAAPVYCCLWQSVSPWAARTGNTGPDLKEGIHCKHEPAHPVPCMLAGRCEGGQCFNWVAGFDVTTLLSWVLDYQSLKSKWETALYCVHRLVYWLWWSNLAPRYITK